MSIRRRKAARQDRRPCATRPSASTWRLASLEACARSTADGSAARFGAGLSLDGDRAGWTGMSPSTAGPVFERGLLGQPTIEQLCRAQSVSGPPCFAKLYEAARPSPRSGDPKLALLARFEASSSRPPLRTAARGYRSRSIGTCGRGTAWSSRQTARRCIRRGRDATCTDVQAIERRGLGLKLRDDETDVLRATSSCRSVRSVAPPESLLRLHRETMRGLLTARRRRHLRALRLGPAAAGERDPACCRRPGITTAGPSAGR